MASKESLREAINRAIVCILQNTINQHNIPLHQIEDELTIYVDSFIS